MQTVRDRYSALFNPAMGRMQLFMGSRTSSWTVLTILGQRLMLMMTVIRTQTHLHQPWRLDRCDQSFNHSHGSWSLLNCLRHRLDAHDGAKSNLITHLHQAWRLN